MRVFYTVKNYCEDSRKLWKGLMEEYNKVIFVLKTKIPVAA